LFMKRDIKDKLGKIGKSGFEVGKVLVGLGVEGVQMVAGGIVAGTSYVAPKVRDFTNKVGPYVIPNLAALGVMNAGIEGFDSVLNLPDWLENGAMTLGTLALGYSNARIIGSETYDNLAQRWAEFDPNLKLAGLALITSAMIYPQPIRDSIVEVFQRGQDIGSQILHSDLDDEQIIEKYAKYGPPVEDRNGKEIVENLESRHKYLSGRPWSGSLHAGLDVSCDVGDSLFPIAAGRVTEVTDYELEKSYQANGKTVRYKLPNGQEVTYLHLDKFSDVKVGDIVTPNTVVGYCGHSGNASSDNVHVHVQIDSTVGKGGKLADPTPYILGSQDSEFEKKVRAKPHVYMPFLRNVAELDGYGVKK
jgi:hypothetical protein